MKKLALLGAVAGLGVGALAMTHTSHAADHLDAPTISMAANRMADLNDVYAWMTSDGMKVNLAMTVSPAEDGTHHFGPSVQYVFHVSSHPGATNMAAFAAPGSETKVICTFASDTSAQCWVAAAATKDYVTGNPSSTAGLTSASGKLKVFAGKRSDPFFFNFVGLKNTIAGVEALGAPTLNAAGCPLGIPATGGTSAATLRAVLSQEQPNAVGPCAANHIDCFDGFNVMAIVVQVDASLLLGTGDHLLSVWGSTHATP